MTITGLDLREVYRDKEGKDFETKAPGKIKVDSIIEELRNPKGDYVRINLEREEKTIEK